MVSIFTGLGSGFERGSGATLGGAGLLGSGTLGRNGEQVSLNAATGNLLISQRDEFLVGRGPDASIARTYNSLGDASDENGDNWRQSTDRRIHGLTGTVNTPGSTVKRVAADGSEVTYSWNGTAYFTTDGAGAYDTLRYDGSGWTWTDGDSQNSERYANIYNNQWRITSASDTGGGQLTFSYNGAQLDKVTTANGEYVQYGWSGNNITEVRYYYVTPEPDASYAKAIYRMYDAAFNRAPDIGGFNLFMSLMRTGYTINQMGDAIYSSAEYQARGVGAMSNDDYVEFLYQSVLRRASDPSGKSLYVSELNSGARTRGDLLTIFSESSEHIAVASAIPGRTAPPLTQGTRTRYGYDGANRLTSVTVDLSPEDNATGDGKTYVTTYTYDGSSKRVASISQTDGSRLDISYDQLGRAFWLSQTTLGAPRITVISYNPGYTTVTDSFNQVTRFDYNADGSLKKVTAPPAYAGAADQVSQFGYDGAGMGNVTSVTDSLGAVTTFTYDGSGNVLTTTDPLGNVVTRTYDGLNNLLTETRTGSDADGAAVSHTTRYAYSGTYLVYSVSAEGLVTRYFYTSDGQISEVRRFTEQRYDISALSPSTSIAFSTLSVWDASVTDRSTIMMTRNSFDSRGNIASTKSLGNPTITDGDYSQTDYVYDQAGQLLSRTTSGLNTERFVYDGLGRVIASTDLSGATTSIVFNDAASRTVVTAANGYVQTSTYSVSGELLSSTDSGAYVNGGTAYYSYDREGQLRMTQDATNHVAYSVYDAVGRKVADVDQYGALTEYRYDANDRVVATIRYGVAITGAQILRLQNMSDNVDLASIRPGSSATDLWNWAVYDADGRKTQSIEGDGSVTTYAYDASDRLIRTTVSATRLNVTQLSYLKSMTSGLSVNRLSNSQFSGSTDWTVGADGSHISDKAPYTTDWQGKGLIKVEFTATAANQIVSIATAETWIDVTSGERLSIQAGVEGIGAVGSLNLVVWWQDANSNSMYASSVATLSGPQWFNTKVGNFVTVPVGAVKARLELYMTSSNAGTGAFSLSEPMVTTAAIGQTQVSSFTPSVAADPAHDAVSRNFYDKDGRLIGVLDGEGYLARTVYDGAGRPVSQTAFATATASNLRASGTFAQLLASVGTSGADRTTRSVYDGQGLLRYSIDAQGNVTEFVYKGAADGSANGVVRQTIRYAAPIGTLTRYTVATLQTALASQAGATANRASFAVYDTANRPTYTIDATGAVTGFGYDAYGRLTKTVQYANPTTVTSLSNLTTWAPPTSTGADRITRNYYTARDELLFTVDAEGYITRFDYDKAGRPVATWRWDQPIAASDATTTEHIVTAVLTGTYVTTTTLYDNDGRVSATYDSNSVPRAYFYNANGTLLFDIAAYGTADESRTAYVYDASGRVIQAYEAHGTPEQRVTQYSYDGLGNLVSTTDANGNPTTFTYDRDGRRLSSTDALGGITRYQYDAFGAAVKTTDPRTNASYAYYDTLGRVTATRDVENYVTETSYTTFGEVASVTRRANRAANAASETSLPVYTADGDKDATTRFSYDKLGRVLSTTDALNVVERYTLNAFGQRATVIGKLGAVTTNAYDRRGLLTSETLPISSVTSSGAVQATAVINRFEYDARGNRTKTIEAAGLSEQRITSYVYDKLDRLVRTRLPQIGNATNTALLTPVETFAYDARGNVIETRTGFVENSDGSLAAVDSSAARTLFWYDKLDRQIATLGATGTYSTTTYTLGNATGGTQANRTYATQIALPASGSARPATPGGEYRESVSSFDKLGRLISTSTANVLTGKWTQAGYILSTDPISSSWQYDADGNVVRAIDANLGSTYSYYDKLGRKTASVDQLGYVTRWTLDAEGNALSETRYATATSGAAVGSLPSVPSAATDRTTTFTYDRVGQRLTETRIGLTYATINPTSGSLTEVTGDATIIYTYNAIGEVLTKTEATGDITSYIYDAAGRLIREVRPTYAGYVANANPNPVAPTVEYSYDGLGQLTVSRQIGDAYNDRFTRYTYGAGGRLTSVENGTQHSYYYDVAGRKIGDAYVRVTSSGASLSEGISFGYDAVGNLVRQSFASVSGGTFTDASPDAGGVTTITYNAYSEMVSRGLNGVTQEQNAYDTAGRLWRSTAGDGVYRYYLYDANGNRTLTLEDNGQNNGALINRGIYDVLAIATNGNSNAIGAVYTANVNVTIAVYDARGQAVSSNQTKRQLSATGTPVDLISQRSYNAFGETLSETDALNKVTSYSYNAIGRATAVVRAAVDVGRADGGIDYAVSPTDYLFYDRSGRLIGQQDANGRRTTRTLLAGTGYGGADPLVLKEFHPDGGVISNAYDVFGDLREVTDAVLRRTRNSYDALGRLTQVVQAGGLVDYYSYDVLGQRIRHTDSVRGGDAETTDYDIQGRVTSTRAFGGDVTSTSYAWVAGLGANGLGTNYGGTTTTVTYANGRTAGDQADAFGHAVAHSDLSGRLTLFQYDSAGRLVARNGADGAVAATQVYTYLNTGLAAGVSTGTRYGGVFYATATATYGYDKLGRKLTEYATTNGQVSQNATAAYDALGRMTAWSEAGNATAPAASVTWSYDAVGNIRHQTQAFSYLAGNGAVSGQGSASWWYAYDAMNRVTIDRGTLSGGVISRGGRGVDLTYDAAGQRRTATSDRVLTGTASVFVFYGGNGNYQNQQPIEPGITGDYEDRPVSYNGATRETYSYNANGTLASTVIDQTDYIDNGDGTLTPIVGAFDRAGGGGVYTYDALGRQTRQIDTNDTGMILYDHQLGYDTKGRVTSDWTSQVQGNDTVVTTTTTNYGDGTAAYALGAALTSDTSGYRLVNHYSWQAIPTSHTATSYDWYDGAVQSRVDYTPDTAQGTTNYTSYVNSGAGLLQSANIVDGRARTVTVTSDALGQVIRRDEEDGFAWNPTTLNGGDPHEVWYRFNGKQIGYTGNNSTYDTSYAGSLADRSHTVWGGNGAFRYGATLGFSYAEFNDQLTPINTYSQGSSGGSYTVRQGDTLASIAAQLWGDASLWYKLAQANGLSGGGALTTGTTLTVPAGVNETGNSASTFRPYDPSDAYGDTSPTTPKPQAAKKNKCGVLGQILLVVIAVAVTIWAGPASIANLTWINGAVAGVAGSLASQAVGLATGIQQKFDFKGLALAAVSGAISGGIGQAAHAAAEAGKAASALGKFGQFLSNSNFVSGAVRGVVSSALTQGIGVATGLQSKFDFVGVAAAGLAGGISAEIGGRFTKNNSTFTFGEKLVTNTASGLANAATRTLVSGGDFGDNLIAALPDIIGQTVGGFIAERVAGSGRRASRDVIPDGPAPLNVLYDGDLIPNRPVVIGDTLPDLSGANDIVGTASRRPTAVQVPRSPEPAPDNYDPRFASNWTGDIIVVGRRPSRQVSVASAASSSHGLGWGIADALGFHPDGLFYEAFAPRPESDPVGFYGRSYNTEPASLYHRIWDSNFRDLPRNTINGFAAQMNSTSTVLLRPEQAKFGDYVNMGMLGLSAFPASRGASARFSMLERGAGIEGRVFASNGSIEGVIGSRSVAPLAAETTGARFAYDAGVSRYRSIETGRFVAARDLPWPDNAGFSSSTLRTVPEGTILDRFGETSGRFLGEPGYSVSARGMAPGAENMPYSQYRVMQSFDARVGPAAPVPAFGARGGATQYLPGQSVQQLLDSGHLVRVK